MYSRPRSFLRPRGTVACKGIETRKHVLVAVLSDALLICISKHCLSVLTYLNTRAGYHTLSRGMLPENIDETRT